MAKTKEPKGGKAKSEVKSLSTVKNASVTKPSQTPNAKSKQIAKETASKINGKKSKPVREPTPPSASSSEADSDSESASDNSESESEVEVKKPAATNGKVNGKVNGKTNGVAKKEVDTSDSSDSSDDDSEASGSDSASEKSAAASDSDDSDSESEDEKPAVVKEVAKKAANAGKAVVNGAAKAVAKATESSDEEDDSEGSDSDSASSEEDGSDSDSSDSEAEAPSKKRKAEEDVDVPAKKAKGETEEEGPKNLFVGNLSWNIDDEWLFREFEEFGEITRAAVMSDKATGRSKGFGYVEFTTGSAAAAALEAKKGALIDGREANVDFSTPRDSTAPKERAQNRAQNFGDSTNPPSDTLFCGNLSFSADENMIGEAFGAHGTVVNIRLPTDMETGNPKGFGYVTFSSVEDAKAAYEAMLGADIGGRAVRLDYATPRPDRNGGGGGGRGGGRGGSFGGRGGGRGGRGGFGDRGGRGGARGGSRGGRGGSTNRGGFGDFKGKKQTF